MAILSAEDILDKSKAGSLLKVRNFSLWGQELDNIEIVQELQNLEVLSLSVNKVHSLRPLRKCNQLKELYLRKNNVSDLAQVAYLSSLPLRVLWLCDNPCTKNENYRSFTIRCCPSLQKLDNIDVTPEEREHAKNLTSSDIINILSSSSDVQVPGIDGTSPHVDVEALNTTEQKALTPTGEPKHEQQAMFNAIMTLFDELNVENRERMLSKLNESHTK